MPKSAFDLLSPSVQKAIWAMGWKELHPIQVEAVRRIIEGENHLILSAQTAGGKTEAAFLPIISKLTTNPKPSVQALYVGPLKALINDQFERLERLCRETELPVSRWHGDVTAGQKAQLRRSPAGILLITPESLESNFINYGVHVPRMYRHLQFVVIDELHSFLDNVRGVHLRSLLARLNIAASVMPRIIGLSATLGDPASARTFLAPDSPESVDVIADPNSSRNVKFGINVFIRSPPSDNEKVINPRLRPSEIAELSARLTQKQLAAEHPVNQSVAPGLAPVPRKEDQSGDDDLAEIATDIAVSFCTSTNLIFVNAKRIIEVLAVKLRDEVRRLKFPADPFVVHHGSLSKELREDAELELKSGSPRTAICSSTLEMGIDIGSVRAVGQVGVPWSVASMVQRLGRSGRREGESAIMRMYIRADSPNFGSTLTDLLYPELLRAIALTRLMLQKWLEPVDVDRFHLSTLVHQVLSCLKQSGGLSATAIYSILIKRGPFRRVVPELFQSILCSLGKWKLIEQCPQGDLILAPAGEKITSSFDFYAAFDTVDEFSVRCGGDHIGSLPCSVIPPVGECLILAGRRWRVEEFDLQSKIVSVTPARKGNAPQFLSGGGQLHSRVVQEMRKVLLDDDEPQWLHPAGRLLLDSARNTAQKSGLAERNVIVRQHKIQWFPWVGSCAFETLRAYARTSGVQHEVDGLSISYRFDTLDDFISHLQEIAASTLTATDLAGSMAVKAVAKFDKYLPELALDIANGHDRLNIVEAKAAAANEVASLNR